VYEETLTGRPHDTSVQKLPVTMKMWMQFNVMPRTRGRFDAARSSVIRYSTAKRIDGFGRNSSVGSSTFVTACSLVTHHLSAVRCAARIRSGAAAVHFVHIPSSSYRLKEMVRHHICMPITHTSAENAARFNVMMFSS